MGKYFPDEGARGKWATCAIAALPLLFLIMGLLYSAASAPWGRQVDPESVYNMNGIAWADDGLMRKNDHPGTTTVLLVGLIVKSWAYLSGAPDVVDFGLKNFDVLIYVSRTIEILILALAMLVGGIIIRRATHSAIAAMLFQVGPFVHLEVLKFETMLAPESLMASSAILGMALVLKAALDEKRPSAWLGVAQGLTFSFGVSSKYLHFALGICGVSLLRNPWALILAFVVAPVSFFIFNHYLNPLVFYLGWSWLVRLATHKGTYGMGEPGFIDFDSFWPNMATIVTAAPIVTAVFVVGAIAAITQMIKSRRYFDPVSLTLLSCVIAFAAQLVATSKHYALHYMLASWVLTGGVLVLTVIEVRRQFPRVSARMISSVAAPVCVALVVLPLYEVRRDALELLAFNDIGARLSQAVAEAGPSCANVSSMFVRAPEDDMNFGADGTLSNLETQGQYAMAYVHLFKTPLLDHDSYDSAGLRKNFLPYTYAELAAEYPCIIVRTFSRLDADASLGLLALKPDYCRVEDINVYTVGIACRAIQDAYARLNVGRAASLSR